jgi:hypothetical protein
VEIPDDNRDLAEEEQTPAASWLNGLANLLPWLGSVFFILLAIALTRRFAPQVTTAYVLKRIIERSGWTPPQWLRRWLVFANQSAIQRYFHTINISLRLMKQSQPVHITAAERAHVLKSLLPEIADSIETLLNEHQSELFTPNGGNEALARRAARNILNKAIQTRVKIIILGYNYAGIKETP